MTEKVTRLHPCPALALLLLVAPAGCGDSGTPGLGILSEGTGPANAEPLVRLASGTRTGSLAVENQVPLADGIGWRNRLHHLQERAEGVFVQRVERAFPNPYPVLAVPTTVRLGMKWETRNRAGGTRIHHEVTGRTEGFRTNVGPRTLWGIEHTYPDDPWASGSISYYLEGIGPVSDLYDPFTVALEQAPEHLEPVVPAAPLTPVAIADGTPFVLDEIALAELLLVDPGDGGPRTVMLELKDSPFDLLPATVGNRAPRCFTWDGTRLAETPGVVPSGGYYHVGATCPGDVRTVGGRLWRSRSTVAVTTEGVVWLPDTLAMTVSPHSPLFWSNLWTAFPGDDGRLQLLTANGLPGPQRIVVDDLEAAPGAPALAFPPFGGWAVPGDRFWQSFEDVTRPEFMVPGPGPTPADRSFALLDYFGRVWHTVLAGDMLRAPRLLGAVTGTRAQEVDPAGQRLVVSTPDGNVDRLVVDATGVRRQRVARVDLPEGQYLAGAVTDRDRILAFTWEPATQLSGGVASTPGTVRAFTAALLDAPVTVPLAPALGVSGTWLGADFRLCFPPTDEPIDPSTWTVGGAPAAAVVPDPERSCALLVRDLDALADQVRGGALDGTMPDTWLHAVGRVPGIGRMMFTSLESWSGTTGRIPTSFAYRYTAKLRDGGGVSLEAILAPGRVEVMRPLEGNGGAYLVGPDAAAIGLWRVGLANLPDDPGLVQQFVELQSELETRVIPLQTAPFSYGGNPLPVGRGFGETGGVLAAGSDALYFARADGTVELVPPAPADQGVNLRRANGEWCGGSSGGLRHFCMNADGTDVRTTDVAFLEVGFRPSPTSPEHGWTALADGTFLVLIPDGAGRYRTGRIDLDSWTLSSYPDEADPAQSFRLLGPGFDGRPWGVLEYPDGRQIAGRFEPDGVVPLDTMPWRIVVGDLVFTIADYQSIDAFREEVIAAGTDAAGRPAVIRYFPPD